MRDTYKEKDFVNYVGHNPSSYGNTNIAQIDSLIEGENYWEFQLTVIEPYEKVYCMANLIRPIFTEAEHLLNLGFVEETATPKTRVFRLGELIVSSFYLYIPELHLHFNSGFCLGNVSEITLETFRGEYLKSNEVDFSALHETFPTLANLNDLIYEYVKYYDFDIRKIYKA